MTGDKKAIGDPLKAFTERKGKLGGNRTEVQVDRGTDIQTDRNTDMKKDRGTGIQKKSVRMKTGFSLDRDLIRRAKFLALSENKDVNDLIEEGLRKVLEERERHENS